MSPMYDPAAIQQRLDQLRHERDAGEAQLQALKRRTEDLQHTLLRIGGAITVLEELLQTPNG